MWMQGCCVWKARRFVDDSCPPLRWSRRMSFSRRAHGTDEQLASDPVLREAARRIVQQFHPRRIVLFGSRAWGKPSDESDYDLLVLVEEDASVLQLGGQMSWALRDLPASFDLVVRTVSVWRQWADAPLTLERRIDREGTDLHGAA